MAGNLEAKKLTDECTDELQVTIGFARGKRKVGRCIMMEHVKGENQA